MSDKPTPELDPLDLVVRARGAPLGASEREALARELARSATARLSYEVGVTLDRTARVRPGDGALIERALEGALAGAHPAPRRRAPRVAALLAATLALTSAAAATRQILVWRSRTHSAEPTYAVAGGRSAPSLLDARSSPRTPAVRDEPAASAVTPSAVAPGAVTAKTVTPGAVGGRAVPVPTTGTKSEPVPVATAASLFHDAGAARRLGDFPRAQAIYLELVARFPESSEAQVARVSLGKLLLGAGNAREADAAFNAYLRSGATALREEALVGRADALMALGRNAEERSVRRELVSRYPTSVYSKRARERLAELDGAGTP
jgi:TolA-binding protein